MINETEFNRQTREHYKKTPSSEMIDTRPGAGREPTDLKAAKERGEKADWAKTKKIENNQGDDPENDVREGDDSLGKPVAGGQLATSHAALGEVAPVMKDEGISDAQRQRDADAPAFRKAGRHFRVFSPHDASSHLDPPVVRHPNGVQFHRSRRSSHRRSHA